MYKARFSIDGSMNDDEIVEGYTDGSTWNGWANVFLTREGVAEFMDGSPYDYRFCEARTPLNDTDNTVVILYFEDGEDVIKSSPIPTDDGQILEGFDFNGYCFVELGKKPAELTADEEDALPSVDIIASGYEWICENCDTLHKEIECPIVMKCTNCGTQYRTNAPEHALD